MSLFNRHESCRGITLFKVGRYRAELWYCPAGYAIREHRHPKEDVELMFLFGCCTFYRRDNRIGNKVESANMNLADFSRRFTVKNYHSHWFTVGRWPLIFINFQRFLDHYKPMSAAEDFQETYTFVREDVFRLESKLQIPIVFKREK